MKFDVGIHCDYFLSMARGEPKIERQIFLGCRDGKIVEVRPAQAKDREESKEFLEAKGKLVMPGLVNTHTHLAMSLMRGMGEDLNLQDWLHKVIFPYEGEHVNPDFVRRGVELAVRESIRFGVTTLADMYFFEDVAADVMNEMGVRAVMGESVIDFPTPDNKSKSGEDYKTLDRMVQKWRAHTRLKTSIAPHAPYTCSDETLKTARDYAMKNSIPLMIHVSETRLEVEESLKKFGKTPVQRLWDLGVMEASCIFAHCVHVTDADIALMARAKVGVAYNPESNMKLGSGIAPIKKMLDAGVRVGFGTDGPASNNDLSIFHEMDTGAKLQKLVGGEASQITSSQFLRMATLGGAEVLGLENITGSLEVGKAADFLVVDLSHPTMQPIVNLPAQIVYGPAGIILDRVYCEGRRLL